MNVLQVNSNNFRNNLDSQNVDQKPTDITSLNNFAVCPHFEFEFSQIATNHFLLLIDSSTDIGSTKQNKSFAFPSLVTTLNTYFQILQNWKRMETYLQNWRQPLTSMTKQETKLTQQRFTSVFQFPSQTQKRFWRRKNDVNKNYHNRTENKPQFSTAGGHEQTQTDQSCTETLERVENNLSGPH